MYRFCSYCGKKLEIQNDYRQRLHPECRKETTRQYKKNWSKGKTNILTGYQKKYVKNHRESFNKYQRDYSKKKRDMDKLKKEGNIIEIGDIKIIDN